MEKLVSKWMMVSGKLDAMFLWMDWKKENTHLLSAYKILILSGLLEG